MDNIIRFEAFQLVSFVLAGSLFLYKFGRFIVWIINRMKPKKPGPIAKMGLFH